MISLAFSVHSCPRISTEQNFCHHAFHWLPSVCYHYHLHFCYLRAKYFCDCKHSSTIACAEDTFPVAESTTELFLLNDSPLFDILDVSSQSFLAALTSDMLVLNLQPLLIVWLSRLFSKPNTASVVVYPFFYSLSAWSHNPSIIIVLILLSVYHICWCAPICGDVLHFEATKHLTLVGIVVVICIACNQCSWFRFLQQRLTHTPSDTWAGVTLLFNIGYPSETHLKFKFPKISFVYKICPSYPIVSKFCTEHSSNTAMIYQKNDNLIGLLKWMLWANETLWDLSLRWHLDGYPILHSTPVVAKYSA